VTVGIAFLGTDEIVIASDTQITYPQNHKYYESKIFRYAFPGGVMGLTYSGNPSLAKMFDGKLAASLKIFTAISGSQQIQDLIETVLSLMDVLDSDPDGLFTLCGIALESGELRLVKTDRKAVSAVSKFDYIGVGDSSLVRFLTPLVTSTHSYTREQAINLAVGLVLQAKRYVDGCGGDTETIVLSKLGTLTDTRGPFWQEKYFHQLEHFLRVAFTDFFNSARSEEEFEDSLRRLTDGMRQLRKELNPVKMSTLLGRQSLKS